MKRTSGTMGEKGTADKPCHSQDLVENELRGERLAVRVRDLCSIAHFGHEPTPTRDEHNASNIRAHLSLTVNHARRVLPRVPSHK